jgi:hypothetical protein
MYAARDPFYKDGVPQELERAWRDGGGRAELVYFAEHALENPHTLTTVPSLWTRRLDEFLKTLDTPKP